MSGFYCACLIQHGFKPTISNVHFAWGLDCATGGRPASRRTAATAQREILNLKTQYTETDISRTFLQFLVVYTPILPQSFCRGAAMFSLWWKMVTR
jgi:hypothetical protein